jgi:hypothetical protein
VERKKKITQRRRDAEEAQRKKIGKSGLEKLGEFSEKSNRCATWRVEEMKG